MSRTYAEAEAAWEAWAHLLTVDCRYPVAFEHGCGALGKLDDPASIRMPVVCPGCRVEITRPERECEPLYGRPD